MSQYLVVTAVGTNRPGIVNQLTQLVSTCGCNIVDSRMALFGSEFTLIMLVSGTHNAIIQIETRLPVTAQELQLLSVLKKTSRHERINYSHAAILQLTLPDATGVISQVTQFISDHDMNMVSLKSNLFSQAEVEMLHASFEVKLNQQHQTEIIEQQFAKLCQTLGSHDFSLQFLSNEARQKESAMNTLTAGNAAPQFDLANQDEKRIKLSDYAGKKVLVYFYPKALTPGCTTQACGLRDSIQQLSDANTVVFGISPDPVKRLPKFIEKHQLNFDLLSDEDHQVAEQFGVWGLKKFMGKEYDGIHRISFLIDEQGIIEHVFDKFKTKEHHQVVLDYLAG